ncbi:MAG: response regulator, partial [Candidatus Omnitrophota bacterium]
EFVVISVENTGAGISKEDIPKLFDKYQQFGETQVSSKQGTGLGLAISKGLVDLQGGKLWVESEESKSVNFLFTIPKYRPPREMSEYVVTKLLKRMNEEKVKQEFSLVIANIANIDNITAKIGDASSEKILLSVENVISKCMARPEDVVTLFDRGKFMVLLPGTNSLGAAAVCERLKAAIRSAKIKYDNKELDFEIQFGISSWPKDGTDAAMLLHSADKALTRKKLVLVVDAHPQIISLVSSRLEKEGRFKCISAENGEEAVEKVFDEMPDLIICDIILPRMNGYEVVGRLKGDEKTRNIPIIILTTFKVEYDKVKTVLPGSLPVVAKSGGFEKLMELVNQLI